MESQTEVNEPVVEASLEGTPMETIYTGMHIIDRVTGTVADRVLDEEDARRYIANITNTVREEGNHKQYKITSETTEVVAIIKQVFFRKEVTPAQSDLIARRLLRTEMDAQERVNHLNIEIKKGSLIQSFFAANDIYYYLLSKVESDEFLDESELIKKSGLPYGRKALKSCLFLIEPDGTISEIYISDTNRSGTNYWHNVFLELQELTSNEESTKKVFRLMTETVAKELKASPTDYVLIRNQIIGYFKTQQNFVFSEAMNYIFGEYTPESDVVDIEVLKNKIGTKMTSQNYDRAFSIQREAITQRMWKVTKKLNDFSELVLNDHGLSIKNSIFSKEIDGEKFIVIKTTDEETFKAFNWDE